MIFSVLSLDLGDKFIVEGTFQALAARFGSLADICSALTNCFCYFDCLLKHAGTGSVLWFPAKILAFDVRFGSKADMCSAQADVR